MKPPKAEASALAIDFARAFDAENTEDTRIKSVSPAARTSSFL
jgi:hypothetical protein